MIRVFRVTGGENLRTVPARAPDFVAHDAGTLRARMTDVPTVTRRELVTIEYALESVAPEDSADVVLAASGSIFRVFRAEPTPSTAAPRGSPWKAAEVGARLLVLDKAPLVRIGEALSFLGYAVETHGARTPDDIERTLGEHDPLVVILGERLDAPADERAVEGCSRKRLGLVRIGRWTDAPADAVIELPLVTARLAGVLDPVVRKARALRAG